MKRHTLVFLGILTVFSLVITACGGATPTPTEAPPEPEVTEPPSPEVTEPPVQETTLTIGFTASQTGRYNVESTRQVNALQLWMDDVNAEGILVGDQLVRFQAVSYDDESTGERVQELYTRLATEDDADFLISPYSSGLTEAAAVIAEQYATVMITTGAANDNTYQQGYTHVFQTYTPASRYLTGALDQLATLDPELTRIAIVHENDSFSTAVANAANTYAQEHGFEVALFEGYDTETVDFSPFINRITAAAPQAILGGGHFQDGSTFTRQLFESGLDIQYLALLVAPPEPTFAELGDAALGVIGPSQWEPLAAFTEESAATVGVEWFGPTGAEFIDAYTTAYGEEPSYHAAGGYAAGLILQKAIMDAGSIEPDAVLAALEAMDIMTFYGRITFDTSPENHGLQIGHSMVYIQWQQGAAGLEKQVVWPLEASTAEALFPLP